MTDIDDLLDDRMKGGGDYPPWWEPEDEGDTLEGIVTEKRLDPWAEENDDDDPGHILHVKTNEGEEFSTRTHRILTNLIKEQGVEVGDFVRIEFAGATRTNSGHMANDYRLGVIKEDELEDLDIEIPDGGTAARQPSGNQSPGTSESSDDSSDDDGPMTPSEAGEQMADPDEADIVPFDPSELTVDELEDEVEEVDDPDVLENILQAEKDGKDRVSAKAALSSRYEEVQSADIPDEAVDFVESLISFHEELEPEELDEYLNETRDFGIDVEDVADAAGLEKNDDGVYVEA